MPMEPIIESLTALREAHVADLDALLEAPAAEGRDLNGEESARLGEIRAATEALDARLTELRSMAEASAAAARALPTTTTTALTVVSEPPVYGSRGAPSMICDLFRSQFLGDFEAAERMARHNRRMLEGYAGELRAVGTPAFGALVPDQFLTGLYAPLARAGRPFADACNRMALTAEGMVFKIPRLTTGTTTAIQATQNASVSSTDLDETTLSVDVRTIAGQQDVSRQALERGAFTDELVFSDLISAYATNVDSQIISGDGTSGTILGVLSTAGINAVTYTDVSPTVGEAYPKIADAIQQVNSNRFLPADLIVMHPRRWGWFTAAVDTQNRPLVVPMANMPQNAIGVGEPAAFATVVGTILGLPVITDASIPTNLGAGTNEDRIIITRRADLLLWELNAGMPFQLRFDQTLGNQLTIKLVVYSYLAFTAGRYPAATSVISGTGLVTPTF